MTKTTGSLYIVATPIGNLEDITWRAVKVLKSVDRIAAEDTRHSKKLLRHLGVDTQVFSLHEHNESGQIPALLDALQQGLSIAVISDAGTPLVSDPGYRLVKAAHDAAIPVVPVPGACAAIAALSAAGLPTDRFVFEGFLPSKANARKARLETLQAETRTLIFYESCHRIVDSLADMGEIFGSDRIAVVARELTKLYETIRQGTLSELSGGFREDPDQQRGEFVVLVAPAEPRQEPADELLSDAEKRLLTLLKPHLPTKIASQLAAGFFPGGKQKTYYRWLAASKEENGENNEKS